MKNITLIALIVFVASCSKDRRVIQKLDGTWKVDSMQLKYVHYINVPFGNQGKTYQDLDTSKQYTLFNCGSVTFNKERTANNDYRLGNLDFKIGKLLGNTDTANSVNRPLNDKESFNFYVDKVINKKKYSKIGMLSDTSLLKTYRSGQFSDDELKSKSISFSYVIDSLDYNAQPNKHNLKLRKGIFKAYISKQ